MNDEKPTPLAAQKQHWNDVANGWFETSTWIDTNFRPLTDWFLRMAGWRSGARALDIACGAGYPACIAASSVGPKGSVVATDLASGMLAAGRRRALLAHLGNMEFVAADAETLPFDAGSFDAVTCATGLMFCQDPHRAAAEIRRVLRPGGRFAVAVWDHPSANLFFILMREAVAEFFSLPPSGFEGPGPFALDSSERLEAIFTSAGLSVTVERCAMTFECGSVAEYCRIFQAVTAGPRSRIATLSDESRARFTAAVASKASSYVEGGRLRLTATALCASGSVPPGRAS